MHCAQRQPTVKQVRKLFTHLKWIEEDGREIRLRETNLYGGTRTMFQVAKPHGPGWWTIVLPCSDISEKCHDCGRILVDRFDGPGCHVPIAESKEYYGSNHAKPRTQMVSVCFGCNGKRLPARRAAKEWARTRTLINKAKKEIAKCR